MWQLPSSNKQSMASDDATDSERSDQSQGGPVMSSKFIEIHFKGDEAVWVGQQMGIGYVR